MRRHFRFPHLGHEKQRGRIANDAIGKPSHQLLQLVAIQRSAAFFQRLDEFPECFEGLRIKAACSLDFAL